MFVERMAVHVHTERGVEQQNRPVDRYEQHPEINHLRVPVPVLCDGEELHYILGEMIPIIIRVSHD